MTREEQLFAAFVSLREEERRAFMRALKAVGKLSPEQRAETEARIVDILKAVRRAKSRQDSDRRTDRNRRKLIGARVKKDFAKRVEDCAGMVGMSVYRFVCNALEICCLIVDGGRTDKTGDETTPAP